MQILNKYTGKPIMEYTGELRDIDLSGKDLSYADLSCYNLRGADFTDSILNYADLSDTNLRNTTFRDASLHGTYSVRADFTQSDLTGSNLSGSNLARAIFHNAKMKCCNLSNTNFTCAKLSNTDISKAILWNCRGDGSKIKTLLISNAYPISYTKDRLQIGCENHKIEDWWSFDHERIDAMDEADATNFWKDNKSILQMIISNSPAE